MLKYRKALSPNFILLSITFLSVLIIALIYGIVMDIVLIIILFLAAFAIGSYINIQADTLSRIIIQSAVGLGILGVAIYLVLFFGLGGRSLYCLLLSIPIIIRYRNIGVVLKELECVLPKSKTQLLLWLVVLVAFIFYIACASAPMDKYDTMTKHLPITMYAASNGQWYTNVTESLVYGETMLLQYTYSVVFVSFDCYKALSLFNVCLIFLSFMSLAKCVRFIYNKSSILFLAVLFFSTPMFFEFSTIFYLDILPAFFVFAGVLCFIERLQASLDNLCIIAFLFGCTMFAKITSSYIILVVGLACLGCCLVDAFMNGKKMILLKKIILSLVLFVSPFIVSLINIWYKTGNPLFPFFNGIFKSPYYTQISSVDPFNTHPLGLTISSLINIVLHTSRNIEMYDGGLGYFLFLIVLFPIAIVLFKNKKFIACCIVPIITFGISCLFTFNLRYSIIIFIMFLAPIVISLSIIIGRFPRTLSITALLLAASVLIIPNLLYIYGHYNIPVRVRTDSAVSGNLNISVMSQIPNNKKILSFNDPFKGNYRGYYSAIMHHNMYNILEIQSGELKFEDYVGAFDYVLYQKNMDVLLPEALKMLTDADKDDSILVKFDESATHILYRVKSRDIIVLDKKLPLPLISRTSAPMTEVIPQNYNTYVIYNDIENTTSEPIEMRWQINWYDSTGQFLDCYISLYNATPGRNVYQSSPINFYTKAAYGVLYITSHNDEEIKVYGYKVTSTGTNQITEIEKAELYSRQLLK